VILLWGVPGDDPLDDVWQALAVCGADARLLDQRDRHEVTMTQDGSGGTVTTDEGTIDLAEVGAAYIRPQESADHGRLVDSALVAWADLTGASVVNRPAAMAANNSKPYQLSLVAGYGFDIPDTIVTTDPEEVRRFKRRHGRVIYKSVSGVRSIVSQLGGDRLERLADVANGPTQFQEYVPGEDVRAHVVGDRVLATAVRSEADDYRYASSSGAGLELAETTLPPEIADRCRDAARGMGLHVAGIDLRHATDGRWVCFEVNPSPAFTFYEQATGQPLADEVARLLIGLDTSLG
jgi:glutathione synthase/RimK-type ligase-like ATP-grasp enzyme